MRRSIFREKKKKLKNEFVCFNLTTRLVRCLYDFGPNNSRRNPNKLIRIIGSNGCPELSRFETEFFKPSARTLSRGTTARVFN